MNKGYVITSEKHQGIVLDAAMIAGEMAVNAITAARYVAPKYNPYLIDNTFYAPDKPLYMSELGTPVYDDVTFESVTYTDAVTGKQNTTPQIKLQAILIDVTFPRKLVKTEIQGRDGVVTEYIGEGSPTVTFRGVITAKNGVMPDIAVANLLFLITAPVPIKVTSRYLNNLDIYTVIFEDRTFGQEEGSHSYQPFTLNAYSEKPLELQIAGF